MLSFENAHSKDVERAVLSVVLDGRHAQAWTTLQEHCPSPLYFWERNHALIAVVCGMLATEGAVISAQTVRDRAGKVSFEDALHALKGYETFDSEGMDYADSVLASIGGVAGIVDLAGAYGSIHALAQNCAILSAHFRQRQLIRLASDIGARAGAVDGSNKLPEIADKAINDIAAIFGLGSKTKTMSQAYDAAGAEHDKIKLGGERRRGTWGIDGLDLLVPLTAGKLVTVSAAPGCGKTSLQLLSGYRSAKALGKGSVGIISMEMSSEELAAVNLSREHGIDRSALENGRLSALQRSQIAEARDMVTGFDYWIKDDNSDRCTIDDVCAWIRQRKLMSRGALHLVCLDYLQLLTSSHAKQGEREMLTEATRRLKGIARELDLCILNLSQMNRQGTRAIKGKLGEVVANPEPEIDDLHGSSSIGKDSDAVIFLWSPKADDRRPTIPVRIKVAKNRGGRTGSIDAEFRRGEGQTFVESSCEAHNPVVSSKVSRMERQPDDSEDLFS